MDMIIEIPIHYIPVPHRRRVMSTIASASFGLSNARRR
jgi:hypothetical protein